MARIDQNSTLGGVRGAAAGLVISSNDQGWFARSMRAPSTPRHASQIVQRHLLSTLGALWRGLSPEDRTTWADQAADPDWKRLDWFGVPYSVGGYGLFVACNAPLLMMNVATLDEAPDPVFPDAPAIEDAVLIRAANSASGSVTFSAPLPESPPFIRIYLTPAAFGSLSVRKWRRALDVLDAHGASDVVALWQRCALSFGLPLVGQVWTLAAQVMDSSGRVSAFDSVTLVCQGAP